METILSVKFFANSLGSEPVRLWLKGLSATDRKTIGEDIKTVQLGSGPLACLCYVIGCVIWAAACGRLEPAWTIALHGFCLC